MSLYICPKTQKVPTGMNLNVDYGLRVTGMRQCSITDCDECPALVGVLVMGEAVCVAVGVHGNSPYPPQYYCKTKTAINKIVLKKIK